MRVRSDRSSEEIITNHFAVRMNSTAVDYQQLESAMYATYMCKTLEI